MSFDQSVRDGGLVVNSSGGGYNGGWAGGTTVNNVANTLTRLPGAKSVHSMFNLTPNTHGVWVIAIGVMLILFYIFLSYTLVGSFINLVTGTQSGFRQFPGAGHPGGIQFAGSNSQIGLGVLSGFSQEDRAREYAKKVSSGFMNSRETPYFPDVTNRVLRMENREKEAVRALGKINQERLRRAADDSSSTAPLAWGPFWKEWQSTHVMDGDESGEVSGFEDTFEKALNQTSVY
jgi:hypothetical protein